MCCVTQVLKKRIFNLIFFFLVCQYTDIFGYGELECCCCHKSSKFWGFLIYTQKILKKYIIWGHYTTWKLRWVWSYLSGQDVPAQFIVTLNMPELLSPNICQLMLGWQQLISLHLFSGNSESDDSDAILLMLTVYSSALFVVFFNNNYIYSSKPFFNNILFNLFISLECKYNKLQFGIGISSIVVRNISCTSLWHSMSKK